MNGRAGLFLVTLITLGSTAAFGASEIPVRITYYSTPTESDWGNMPTEPVTWHLPGKKKKYTTLFVKDFASRSAEDPKNPLLMGVGMEGYGYISFDLHQNDPILMKLYTQGYRMLAMDEWDDETQTVTYMLDTVPRSWSGTELKENVSAAIRENNKVFPLHRWVKLELNGEHFGYRYLDDICSSCEVDEHIDIYVAPDVKSVPVGQFTAQLMPPGFKPPKTSAKR